MKTMRSICLCMIVLILSSCSLFSPVKNNDQVQYQLSSIPCVKTKAPHRTTLLVLKPEASALYNSKKMIYMKPGYQISYFAKNRWADTPSNMLQQLMIQTLHNTHYFRAIIVPPTTAYYDYVLNTQLIELVQDFTVQPSVVRVKMRAQLIRSGNFRVIKEKQFCVTVPAPMNSPQGGVIAANHAVARLLGEISRFCT